MMNSLISRGESAHLPDNRFSRRIYIFLYAIGYQITNNIYWMGNSIPVNPKLNIHIETEKPFYNSGSNIEGVVFVDAKDDFDFDALYIRVEGNNAFYSGD